MFAKREKLIAIGFTCLGFVIIAIEIWIEVIRVNDGGLAEESVELVLKSLILVALVVVEMVLETVLQKNYPVQYVKHKFFIRNQTFWMMVSLAIQIYLDAVILYDERDVRISVVFVGRILPPVVLVIVKENKDCLNCFNKHSEYLEFYSIFSF